MAASKEDTFFQLGVDYFSHTRQLCPSRQRNVSRQEVDSFHSPPKHIAATLKGVVKK